MGNTILPWQDLKYKPTGRRDRERPRRRWRDHIHLQTQKQTQQDQRAAVEEKIQQQFRITATGIVPRGCQTTTRISPALFQLPSLFPDVVTKKHRPQG
jgi:hypothetical protein